jgi:ligand-binding sensor domain-containing protein
MLFRLLLVFCCAIPLQAQIFTTYNTTNSTLPDNIVNTLLHDANSNTWVGTENGLLQIDADNNWTVFNTSNSGIPGNTIRSLYQDFEGNIWVGTQLNGMGKFDGESWTNYNPLNSGLPEYHVRAFAQSADGTFWIGTPAGLVRWDGADDWFTYPMSDTGFLYINITSVYIDAANQLFMGTINGGLATLIDETVTHYRTDNSGIGDNTIADLQPDADGNLWMATAFDADGLGYLAMDAYGLTSFNGSEWETWNTDNSGLPSDYLNDVAVHPDGTIYIATDDAGLSIFDRNATGISSTPSTNVQVYPNPSHDVMVVQAATPLRRVEIRTLQGRYLSAWEPHTNTWVLEVEQLPAGMYQLTVITEKGRSTQQIVVQ